MTQILGFAFAGASTVTALAMLLLVVWQAPRHRHNRRMAVYLATLVFWGASALTARLCAVLGCDAAVFMLSSVFGNGLNSLALFWFVTDYVGVGRRTWVRAFLGLGLLWVVVGGIALYTDRVLVDLKITPDGLALYRFSSFSLPIFLVGHGLYLTALGCLWIHRRGGAGALLPGAVVLIAGQAATLLLLPFVRGVPPITMAFTAVASVCFTYAILRESLFHPLARSEASLAAVLENTTDPVWSVDAGGRLTTFNAAFQSFVSSLTGSIPTPGQLAVELFPEEGRLLWTRLYARALKGERVSVERQFDVPGVPEQLEIRLHPIAAAGDAPSGVAVFARDVTAHARVAAAQARAREAAEDANRAKSQFLASVSHELRTPLNAVLGFAQVLAGRGAGTLTTRQGEMVGNILTAGRYLLALINDLIDLSKIEAGKLDLAVDRFALREQVAATVDLLAPAAGQKRIELIVDVADGVPDALIGDPRRLQQVLMNLVGNAVKFTERGHVLVRVEQEAETYGGVRLRFDVVDTGIGFTDEQRTNLFEAFVQVPDAGGGQDGVGLGLAISRRLVETMGGHLSAESEPGAGSTFSFTLPFALAPSAPAEAGASLSGTSVLVVDDNDTLREVLGRWLTGWRVRPTLVADTASARAALERARLAGTPFDTVLIDVELEGSATLLASAAGGPLATVAMLPSAGEAGTEAPLPDHAVHIRKPFAPDQLRAALGTARSGVEGEAPVSGRPRRSARPLRILVAEDSLTNQAIATALLERWGHTVTQAGHGGEAVAALHERAYDLVLMDLQMPGVDGLEATRRIRARERATTGRVPIVAMTASAMKGDRERCLEAGMDAYLAKPIDADELFETVERVAAPALSDGPERGERERFPDGADVAAIVDRLEGDHAAARTMARLFLAEYPRCLTDLRAALGAADPTGVSRAAHALKGSIGLFSAIGYDAARRLELIGHQGALVEAPGALALLEAELTRLRPLVQKLADVE